MFSNTLISLYLIAKESLLFIKNRLVTPGWLMSWPKAEIIHTIKSCEEKVSAIEELRIKYKKP